MRLFVESEHLEGASCVGGAAELRCLSAATMMVAKAAKLGIPIRGMRAVLRGPLDPLGAKLLAQAGVSSVVFDTLESETAPHVPSHWVHVSKVKDEFAFVVPGGQDGG